MKVMRVVSIYLCDEPQQFNQPAGLVVHACIHINEIITLGHVGGYTACITGRDRE